MIAPMTVEALTDVARALGYELVCRDGIAVPIGVEAFVAATQSQYALLRENGVAFDGTARECSAFLIGWRDLRTSVLGAVRAVDAQPMPEMSGRTRCGARDEKGHVCIASAGHPESQHAALVRWENPR